MQIHFALKSKIAVMNEDLTMEKSGLSKNIVTGLGELKSSKEYQ